MYGAVWDNTSFYFILTSIISIMCLSITCIYWKGKSHFPDCSKSSEAAPSKPIGIKKPLDIVKKLAEELPQEVKVLEKK